LKRFRVTSLFDGSAETFSVQHDQAVFSPEIPRKDGRIFEIKPVS
ncbi:MAG: hypothetical protein HY588_00155, partial [Candidatus Omnitrophica bacterium]|nr:hypothetical protein [Candidatus Omnitrophota bacterium]